MTNLLADVLADPAVATLGFVVGMAVLALWVAAAWWAYTDATRRADSILAGSAAAAWILLSTPLLLPLSLAVYAFSRPQVPAGEQRIKTLIEQIRATAPDERCETCGEIVESAWIRCPTCAAWLMAPCASCSRWADVSLELCPWCGEEARDDPFVRRPALVPVMATGSDGVPDMATALADGAGDPDGSFDADELDDDGQGRGADERPAPRARPTWRPAAPGIPRSLRGADGRLVSPGRRLGRSRLGA
ncbi:MAG TPA: zinc ribbon domain-containing protein [Candidatus Binatia bacterium]|nr:zinc ribbon domain-containing protein [Candidatus Binatia bacterium]